MTDTLRPEDLLLTATKLAVSVGKGRPRQTDLRRAISTIYYAMFHTLAKACADHFVGKSGKTRTRRAWAQAYRSLDHGRVKSVCASTNSRIRNAYKKFPNEVRAFGDTFVALQLRRHAADYDPFMPVLLKSEVEAEIAAAAQAIKYFAMASADDRNAFCAFVSFDLRP